MAELCLMASHGYPPGLLFNHDHGTKLFKDSQQFSPQSTHPKQDIITGSALFTLAPIHDQRFDRVNGMLEPRQWINPTVNTPVIIDRQDAIPNTELISFDISNADPDEILRLSMPMPMPSERAQEDLIQLSSFVAAMRKQVILQPLASLVYPSSKFESQQLLLDFVGDLARNSKLKIHSDGRVEFTGSGTEMKDLLSIIAEFYLSRSPVKFERHSSLVPHFNWLSTEEARSTIDASLKFEAATLPVKSPNKIKIKTPRKQNSRRLGQDRNLYKRNYFHACESLLSLMLDRRQQGKTAILTLKNAGPELPDLLNRFSAGIAGTGITVLFNVMVQLASGRVPFCSSKVLSTGLGVGLVWLSWAVNKLGTTVVHLKSRNGGKSGLKEEKMVIERVDQSLKEIYFRAVTVMVIGVLRLA